MRDKVSRAQEAGDRRSKKMVTSEISAFIQNIHHFRDEGLRSNDAPSDHVIVFDEAQRAWDQVHAEKFMRQKRGISEFEMSEPEFLISVMDRHADWCTIICLIGGGQEINAGEAGLTEWFDALQKRFNHWDVYYPKQITQESYSWGQNLPGKLALLKSVQKEELHLAVSLRSFRAEKLSDFVGAIIKGTEELAHELYSSIGRDYPIVLTRDIARARVWLKEKARGTERFGLMASSGGIRLKPEGINVKTRIDAVSWFLNYKNDIRSSFYLEDVATEFSVQGLELDWTGVCWDADFRREGGKWALYAFTGTKWQHVKDKFRGIYLANAYRVLLTRARQGMVIFVPRGDENDYTRPPTFYDETYNYLSECGIPTV